MPCQIGEEIVSSGIFSAGTAAQNGGKPDMMNSSVRVDSNGHDRGIMNEM